MNSPCCKKKGRRINTDTREDKTFRHYTCSECHKNYRTVERHHVDDLKLLELKFKGMTNKFN